MDARSVDVRDQSGKKPEAWEPHYRRIYRELYEAITRGTYRPGDRLPAQKELAESFGVAYMTVRQAVALLERDQLIVRRQGLGTFVAERANTPTVLVVDDEPDVRFLIRSALTGSGCRIFEAEDGFAALRILENQSIAAVFADLRMPRMDGVELIRVLRHRWPGTVVVAVTAFPDDLSPLGGEGWPLLLISKPFKRSQVRDALRLALGREVSFNDQVTAASGS